MKIRSQFPSVNFLILKVVCPISAQNHDEKVFYPFFNFNKPFIELFAI